MSRSISWIASLLCTLVSLPLVSSSPAVAQGYQLCDQGTLGPPGSGFSVAHGISATGLVTGGSSDGTTPTRVFLYSGGVMHSLGFFDYITIGNSINTSGQIAGDVIVQGINTFAPHAFVFSGGVFTDLGTLPGFNRSSGSAINNGGQVAVTMYNFNRGTNLSRAMLWQKGTFTDVGAL